jgi:sulfur carrier protein ThiS adenylyltransferase
MLAETFLTRVPGVPLVAASGLAGYAPSNSVTTRRVAGNLYLVGDGETAARPGEGLMAPRVGVAAHHQANAVLRLLLGEEPA